MKKIAVVFSYPLCIRNFIHSGLFHELTTKGYSIHILSPYAVESFTDEWGHVYPNTHVPTVGWDEWGTPLIEGTGLLFRLLVSFRIRGYSIEYPNGSLQTMELAKPNSLVWFFSWMMVMIFPRKSKARRWLRSIYDGICPTNQVIASFFEREKPDLLITATMGHLPMDFFSLTYARKHKTKMMCILLSWDNLYSRGPVYKHPDLLLVWSQVMKRQALAVHQFSENQVKVAGPLQFVNYAEPLSDSERKAVRDKFSLSANDRYILFVCGARTPQYDMEDIEELVRIRDHSEYKDHKIIVRPHPQVDGSKYDPVKGKVLVDYSPSLIKVDNPGGLFKKSEVRHMAALLSEAEYVVSSWGTTALLEACIFDRKVVQLNWFASVPHQDAWQINAVKNFQKYYHMLEFDEYQGRLVSNAPNDLVSKFNELNTRETFFAGNRRRIRTDFTYGDYSQVNANVVREVERLS